MVKSVGPKSQGAKQQGVNGQGKQAAAGSKRKLSVPKMTTPVQHDTSDESSDSEEETKRPGDSSGEHSDSESSVYSELSEDEGSTSSSEEDDEEQDLNKSLDDEIPNGEKQQNSDLTPRSRPSKPVEDEYAYDSSDEEELRNTVGNIPMKWYDEYDHLGYDWDGLKVKKPPRADEMDKFLTKMDDPNYWRTVHDKMTGQDVVLSNEDVDAVQRIQRGAFPDPDYNPYEPFSDFFTFETRIHPVTNRPEHKRSFIPSLIEKEKVSKMVYAIKMGWMDPNRKPPTPTDEMAKKFYMLWSQEQSEISKRLQHYIPAPKIKLPGHEESYNPPPEYLFTEEEEAAWRNKEPHQRAINFVPQKFSSLRAVPLYDNGAQERFERCLDLYLCPRQRKTRLNIEPEDLIPKLPKPKDLQPFPTTISLVFKGHTKMVRCITLEPLGQFFASGSDDNSIKIWEVQTGRCFSTIPVNGVVTSIAWCPNANVTLIAATVNNQVLIINPKVGDKVIVENTNNMITGEEITEEPGTSNKSITWRQTTDEERKSGYLVVLEHTKPVTQVTWHCKGDYFATVAPTAGNSSVHIHQLSKRRSQQPFNKSKGLVQKVLFHPIRPYFFVASQKHVRIYNLMKQELSKKLLTNCKWVSSMAVHPGGDNVIVGSYDCRLGWFDLDLSTKPYQMLRHHKKAVRQVAFHQKYPLFASASDDASTIVCHGMVYNDLLQNPLIVPVKVLRGHESRNDIGVMDCQFHPTQPWLLTSGADGRILLYT